MDPKSFDPDRISLLRRKPSKPDDSSEDWKEEHKMEAMTRKLPWYHRKTYSLFIAGIAVVVLTTALCLYQTFQAKGDFSIKVVQDQNGVRLRLDGDVVPVREAVRPPVCGNVVEDEKFDCHPEPNTLSEENCAARGCCWGHGQINKVVGVPSCYYPANYSGYRVSSVRETRSGLQARLHRMVPSGFPKDIHVVQVNVMFMDQDRLRIKIFDPNAVRYEVPFPVLRPAFKGRRQGLKHNFHVAINEHGDLTITRRDTRTKIFDGSLSRMIFANQLLQLNIKTQKGGYYGLGESKNTLLHGADWQRYILFNRDNYPTEELNMYGTHPFYIQMEKDAKAHGVFLFNSNSMEVITQPTPGITFRTIGGIFDFYIFMGPSPGDVIRQYTGLVGRSFMPPYWSLGFHLSRYGYGSVEATRRAWKRTMDAEIPFDVQWNDIDYMDNYNDFTVDPVAYKDLKPFVEEIHKNNMKYVMITDVGIGGPELSGKYSPYDDGVEMDCLVKNSSGDVLTGKVWNNGVSTAYPDFTHPRAGEYLTKQYQHLFDLAPYDGSWIDMNEPANFVNGSTEGCPESELERPPYVPGNLEALYTRTLCMTAQHHSSTHYNIHNIHSLTQAIATNVALRNILNKRPFIISRSTFAGFGKFAGHWNGDISSNWDDYRWSIPSLLSFGMFGVPMMGADICGFKWNTTEELCARWQTLGAFYPFSRNHNDFDTFEQDPVIMGPVVTKAARHSLQIRYRLLPYLYTLFYRSHVYGDTVARPIFFEFPEDPLTHDMDKAFLWGPSLMIVPVLNEGTNKAKIYVPKDVWYDYNIGVAISDTGTKVEFVIPIDTIQLLFRGGHVIPTQEPGVNTVLSRKNKFGLLVLLKDDQSEGELYWDDGESLETYERKAFNLIKFIVVEGELRSQVVSFGYKEEPMILGSVQVLGLEGPVSKVTLNGQQVEFIYNGLTKLMIVKDLSQSLVDHFKLKWE